MPGPGPVLSHPATGRKALDLRRTLRVLPAILVLPRGNLLGDRLVDGLVEREPSIVNRVLEPIEQLRVDLQTGLFPFRAGRSSRGGLRHTFPRKRRVRVAYLFPA